MSESKPFQTVKDRVKMALSEAGFPDAIIHGPDNDPSVVIDGFTGPPGVVCWKAMRLAHGNSLPCFPCWDVGYGDECADGRCHADEIRNWDVA
jgi:hypothetical protein